jgi:hypothetical protein
LEVPVEEEVGSIGANEADEEEVLAEFGSEEEPA